MPILPSSIQKPSSPVAKTYVPPGGQKYIVTATDSWASLASARKMTAWDLIRYNYPGLPADQQQAAREVNWYLQEYVGCTSVTADSRNYSFKGARPGEIWLPVSGAAAPPVVLTADQVARRNVLDTLRGPTVAALNFGVGDLFIPARQYELIAKAIEDGHITVVEDATLSGSAVYYAVENRINVPAYGGSPGVSERALIIHECTHAIFDLRMMSTRVEVSEAFAYLAQALYSNLNGLTHRHVVSADPADPLSWISWQAIFDESKRLAEVLKRQYRVTEAQAGTLYSAIKNANFYRARVGKPELYDGLPTAFYEGL